MLAESAGKKQELDQFGKGMDLPAPPAGGAEMLAGSRCEEPAASNKPGGCVRVLGGL